METPTTGELRPAARLTVLTGPSGAGRRRVIELARARSPEVWRSVPVTTRARRPGEVDGLDHRFVRRTEFERLLVEGGLLEWTEFAGTYYGTAREPVMTALGAGRPVLLSVDPAGARQVRRALPEARLVYLAAPHAPALRSGESPSVEFDVTIVTDTVVSAAERLVRLLGSPTFITWVSLRNTTIISE